MAKQYCIIAGVCTRVSGQKVFEIVINVTTYLLKVKAPIMDSVSVYTYIISVYIM